MECLEVLRKMYEVLDNPGRVEPSQEAQAHLEECPNCQKLFQLDRSVKEAVRRKAATVPAPLGLSTRIRQEIEDLEGLTWQKKLSWLVPGRPWGWAGAASVMVVLLLLIGIWTLRVQPSVTEWFLEEHAE